MNVASLFNLYGPDLVMILLIVLLLFGTRKLLQPGEEAEQPRGRENSVATVNRLLIPLAIAIFLLACGLWAFGNGR